MLTETRSAVEIVGQAKPLLAINWERTVTDALSSEDSQIRGHARHLILNYSIIYSDEAENAHWATAILQRIAWGDQEIDAVQRANRLYGIPFIPCIYDDEIGCKPDTCQHPDCEDARG